MGFEYALVHVKYTIPPAILLSLLYRPLFTKLDAYKIGFLITIAVVSTIPWDSYLIRNRIWSYPSHVIIGPKLFDIPLEEVFFFVIQTYNTSLLYLALSKPTFQPLYVRAERSAIRPDGSGSANRRWRYYRMLGQCAIFSMIFAGWRMLGDNSIGTYTGLIVVWAGPFILLLWSLSYQFILGLPFSNTLIPIALPTLYLWIVDTLALKRGTWVISTGTKFGVHLWDGLEIEEALFFLLTNILIVFGQLAFDNALSIIYAFPAHFPNTPNLPSPWTLIKALLLPASLYDDARLIGLEEAVLRLKRKSRSFYLASSTFQGQLRTDLLLLYSFCRVGDDLVDNASSAQEAHVWIKKLQVFLGLAYGTKEKTSSVSIPSFVAENFPVDTHSALLQLPTTKLGRKPLEDLLRGFEMDLAFNDSPPINTEEDLTLYAERVAGTVAQMCIGLVFNIYPTALPKHIQSRIIAAGNQMGIALQYVNIARDIAVDARIGRVYLPVSWLSEAGLAYGNVLKNPEGSRIEKLRTKLLDKAFDLYESSKGAIEDLPIEARGPIRVAVESYMEIGRVLRQDGYVVKAGRATVPKWRRIRVAWKTLNK
ncbi:Lycopene beta-cyclase [Corynespora cassiicola Philippines]|uniref:Bifunctional lycopene cyclase/phytoene synthase n=1 Tax=Corynespora cassiicola Philippines TaxID=1448308 RepID=A0A2T2NYP6_CORCC|nr:Lycopene beta-cyclase [Corynespora cassiicola Philippines]